MEGFARDIVAFKAVDPVDFERAHNSFEPLEFFPCGGVRV